MFSVFRVAGEFRNLLVSTQFVAPHPTTLFFSCPLALLVLPSQCPILPLLIMPGTVQSDCFGSLRVLPQDLLFVLTLDVMSVFVLVAFYRFLVRFSDSCARLLIRLSFNRVISFYAAAALPDKITLKLRPSVCLHLGPNPAFGCAIKRFYQ